MTRRVSHEEGDQDEDRSLSYRNDHSTSVRGRTADQVGSRRANRKVRRVLPELVRDARQGAGLLQRAVHGHPLQLTKPRSASPLPNWGGELSFRRQRDARCNARSTTPPTFS